VHGQSVPGVKQLRIQGKPYPRPLELCQDLQLGKEEAIEMCVRMTAKGIFDQVIKVRLESL
jgi:hypothetical protein